MRRKPEGHDNRYIGDNWRQRGGDIHVLDGVLRILYCVKELYRPVCNGDVVHGKMGREDSKALLGSFRWRRFFSIENIGEIIGTVDIADNIDKGFFDSQILCDEDPFDERQWLNIDEELIERKKCVGAVLFLYRNTADGQLKIIGIEGDLTDCNRALEIIRELFRECGFYIRRNNKKPATVKKQRGQRQQ